MSTIREDLIHYIWLTKSFDQKNLKLIDGRSLEIISKGHHNSNAGPDFLDARINIDRTIWAGHIEIHLKASDWLRHRHNSDPQYQNVILHVVLDADIDISLTDGTIIPCLALRDRIDHNLIGKYQYLQNNRSWIPCEKSIVEVDEITKEMTKDRSLAERLTSKSDILQSALEGLSNDLNELIYQRLAWAFGLKVNAEAMTTLAKSLPYKMIQKHGDQLVQIEALLFGQSGLLDQDIDHPYVKDLHREYTTLKAKFSLRPISPVLWKYARLRPPAFPTIRLAQFARFLYQVSRLDDLLFNSDLPQLRTALDITLSGYWEEHYRFGVSAKRKNKHLGDATKDVIIVNAIVPLLFMYGRIHQEESYKEKAIALLESVPPEHNGITRRWVSLGMTNQNAAESQALLELKKTNCDQHKCMQCPLGHKIITSG